MFSSAGVGRQSTLDKLLELIDWTPIERQLRDIFCAAKGEPAWPPLALFKAVLIAVWHDLSDVRLAEALVDRALFRRRRSNRLSEPCRSACGLGWSPAPRSDHSFKAHVGADADTAQVKALCGTRGNVYNGRAGGGALLEALGEVYADSAYSGPVLTRRSPPPGRTPNSAVPLVAVSLPTHAISTPRGKTTVTAKHYRRGQCETDFVVNTDAGNGSSTKPKP